MPRRADSTDDRKRKREIGARIRTERNAAGLTQEQLARKLGLSPKTVATWENQQRDPPVAPSSGKLERIAAALGCAPSALQSGVEEGSNAYEIDLRRLAKKLKRHRVQDLSKMPEPTLQRAVDGIISQFKDARESRQNRESGA